MAAYSSDEYVQRPPAAWLLRRDADHGATTPLPDLVAFLAYSEAGVFDRRRGRLRRRPLGWSITRYGGTADGHAEFKGYLGGRGAAQPNA